jgi:hypothetical protein
MKHYHDFIQICTNESMCLKLNIDSNWWIQVYLHTNHQWKGKLHPCNM